MAVSRAGIIDANFIERVRAMDAPGHRRGAHALDEPVVPGTTLSARMALRLFEAQVESRLLDLLSRDLKTRGESFYTIGSSGHEGNAAVAASLEPDDVSFLHYRSGAFYAARAQGVPGPHGAFDVLLGVTASADEDIAGGRHKVFGSVALNIPPQTSTIASHLPKALGFAVASDRREHRDGRRNRRIAVCTFGDASANHATSTTAFNAAGWASYQNIPAPVLFVCEDNGYGISVRTPRGWLATSLSSKAGLRYFAGDGRSLPSAWDAARAAVGYVRATRRPAILHLHTVRLLGHAGSDVEQLYRTTTEIEQTEALDPVLASAALLVDNGWLDPDEVLAIYEDTRARLAALGEEAVSRPKLVSRDQVMAPLPARIRSAEPRQARADDRHRVFGDDLPEASDRPRHLAMQLNRALTDVLAAYPEAVVFGEDVARKGGVYHVTAGLTKTFGVGRVFNTLLDETTILGLAIGAGHAGLLPIPEIQYLAYLMNAIDQLRGEAGSMQFFSKGQFRNPMVVRIAGLAYQKGFGGHFHNDNGIAALREIPGVLIGCPARGDDAVRMLRTLVAQASEHGRVAVLIEPIALYMTKDLHEDGDSAWLTHYPAPGESLPFDEVGVYGDGDELCIASYANGLVMSLRVAERLRRESGRSVRVVDLRWLHPLPIGALVEHVRAAGNKLLIVDECRASSGIADTVAAEVGERIPGSVIRRVTGPDTYIPLGAAANLVLVDEAQITHAATSLLELAR